MPKLQKKTFTEMRSPEPVIEPQNLRVDRLLFFSLNPRTWFDPQKLQELADSLKANALIAPIIVREIPDKPEYYEVIVGARRVKACKLADILEIRAEIRVLNDREALVLAKEENSNREDPSFIEDTISTLNLIKIDTGLEHDEITPLLYQMVKGRNVPTDFKEKVETVFSDLKTITFSTFVKDRLRLLNLPQDIYEAINQGQLDPTKGVAIAKVKDETQRQELLAVVIASKLSIAEIKAKAAQLKGISTIDYSSIPSKELESQVRSTYGKLSRNKKVWVDPGKRKKIESLLKSLNNLIDD